MSLRHWPLPCTEVLLLAMMLHEPKHSKFIMYTTAVLHNRLKYSEERRGRRELTVAHTQLYCSFNSYATASTEHLIFRVRLL